MKNVYKFIASKEDSSGQLFNKWSLSQLATYMREYAALNKVASSQPIISESEANGVCQCHDPISDTNHKGDSVCYFCGQMLR